MMQKIPHIYIYIIYFLVHSSVSCEVQSSERLHEYVYIYNFEEFDLKNRMSSLCF